MIDKHLITHLTEQSRLLTYFSSEEKSYPLFYCYLILKVAATAGADTITLMPKGFCWSREGQYLGSDHFNFWLYWLRRKRAVHTSLVHIHHQALRKIYAKDTILQQSQLKLNPPE